MILGRNSILLAGCLLFRTSAALLSYQVCVWFSEQILVFALIELKNKVLMCGASSFWPNNNINFVQPIFRLFGLCLVLRLDDILNHHQQSMKDLAIFVGLNATHTHTDTQMYHAFQTKVIYHICSVSNYTNAQTLLAICNSKGSKAMWLRWIQMSVYDVFVAIAELANGFNLLQSTARLCTIPSSYAKPFEMGSLEN